MSPTLSQQNLPALANEMNAFFESGACRSVTFRQNQLKKLLAGLKRNESQLVQSLSSDLGRPAWESFIGEIDPLFRDLELLLRKLPAWSKPQRQPTPWWRLSHFWSRAEVTREAYGLSLILSPWNYPIQLSLMPLAGSMAAGNVSILKPSEWAPRSSRVIQKVVEEELDPRFVKVVEGGKKEADELLNLPLKKVFFTGSSRVGRLVYQKAADKMAAVTLELGGKSPAIISRSAHFSRAAQRILWGKCFNAGQTCVAPDFAVIPVERTEDFLKEAEAYSRQLPGNFGQICHAGHFDRLQQLVSDQDVLRWDTPDRDKLHFPLSIVKNPPQESALHQEEVFGPILPVYTYTDEQELEAYLRPAHSPLVIYFFSENRKEQKRFQEASRSGAFVVNDVLIHLTHPRLPFGGLGNSGVGSYHGRYSFECFTYPRAIERRPLWDHWAMRFPPYRKSPSKWLRRFI